MPPTRAVPRLVASTCPALTGTTQRSAIVPFPLAPRSKPARCWSDLVAIDAERNGLDDLAISNEQLLGMVWVIANGSD
jgi:hypothetical protein